MTVGAMRPSCLLVLALLLADAAAAADAGSVLFARGTVTAERQPPVPLAKGDAVLDDDTVTTGEASRAQLLLFDGAKIALQPIVGNFFAGLNCSGFYLPGKSAKIQVRSDHILHREPEINKVFIGCYMDRFQHIKKRVPLVPGHLIAAGHNIVTVQG